MTGPGTRSENRLAGRVRRYARVGTTVAAQAAKLAGARLVGGFDRSAHAAELKAALGVLKGPLMKVGQMMATIPDALPAEYAAELAQLQANAPPMGKPFVRRRMAAELGPDWQRYFAEFPLKPAAAASLGQVHRARLHDGRIVACKLQYPDIESAVEADLSQLGIILSIWRRFDNAIDTSRIYEEISTRLREELDYTLEAKHMRLYGYMLASEPCVHVPEPIPELSTRRLLTMSWLAGQPLIAFRTADQQTRNELALGMFRAWYVPFYEYGVIHGDPHLGNYTVRPDLSINLLDFGCVRIFPPSFVKGVIDLYWALVRDDHDLAVAAYERWGFSGLTRELIEVLNEWARFLYGPLMENRTRKINDTNVGEVGRKVVEHVHRRLREVGGVTVPREFVFMDRAAIGLGSVFLHLAAEVNWYELFMSLIEGFDVEAVAAQQARALEVAGLTSRA
jgi:predicted unusual protein kinase regulating ubiquinone biosynthesis (AarF/ABC1/UbiB family)